MSHLTAQEIACPSCKQPNEVELWTVMNVREDPELKDLLLGGEINMVECVSCKDVFYAESFVLYHDPDNEILAFVYPSDKKELGDLLVEKTMADFNKEQSEAPAERKISYQPASFFGLNELVQFVEKDEEVSLQSEVADAIARQHGLTVRTLRPYLARSQDLPRVLPVDGSGAAKPAVLGGLRRLTSINDRLTVYNATLIRLGADDGADVRFS